MGQKSTTQTTTIPGRTDQENLILQLLQRLSQRGVSQLGDLSALARGEVGGPTGQDVELVAQSIGRASQLAQQQLQTVGQQLESQARESLLSRGVPGASVEILQTLLNTLGTTGGITQSILGAQQAGGEALMNLPFQRSAMQLQANQALFNQILGSASPLSQILFQERAAQPTTTQTTSGFDLGTLAQLGGLAASIFSSGATLPLAGLFGGGATSSLPSIVDTPSSLLGGFQEGLRFRG